MGTTKDEADFDGPGRLTYQELLEKNRELKQRLQAALAQIEKPKRLVEKLRGEGKRQAAPFHKQDQPSAEPKQPGRKSGRRHGPHAHRSVPPRIDESYDVPLPTICPHCGGTHFSPMHIAWQYQTEIPRRVIYRRFKVHVGRCHNCRRTVEGRHALQTSTARGAAASQLGPNVQATTIFARPFKLLQALLQAEKSAFATCCVVVSCVSSPVRSQCRGRGFGHRVARVQACILRLSGPTKVPLYAYR